MVLPRAKLVLNHHVGQWALCLLAAVLLTGPLILKGAVDASTLSTQSASGLRSSMPVQALKPRPTLGHARLDLTLLAQSDSVDHVDNIRWSLARRTPAAADTYDQETGVDWRALRQLSQSGTILLPARRSWSFNETFQRGPGYKDAGGILAGGHCALATLFRAAADTAGLPTESTVHNGPIPGFSHSETVNIYWGRDDLLVHNQTDQDLYLVWSLAPGSVDVTLLPVSAYHPLPTLPDLRGATAALVYGHPGPGGWGSLGRTTTVDQALYLGRSYAERVDQWNSWRSTAVVLNPNVVMAGQDAYREAYLQNLIAEARRQGIYVMLDVQTGDQAPLPLFARLMDQHMGENVWYDWDIEHAAGGHVDASQINQVAELYFRRRKAAGYRSSGIFAFYVFGENQVPDPAAVRRSYDGGVVVPIFDGYGGHGEHPGLHKIIKTRRVISLFGEGPFGIMEFETRWGTRYDQITARDYLSAFPDVLIFAAQ